MFQKPCTSYVPTLATIGLPPWTKTRKLKMDLKNKIRVSWIIITAVLTTLTSCSTDIDVVEYVDNSKPIELILKSKHDSTGYINRPKTLLTADNEKFKRLIDWGTKNTEGWESDFNSYVMADAYLIQKDFRLSYYKSGFIILNIKDKEGKPQQVKKKINQGDLDFLLK
jgi:hypothetical protein